MSRPEHSSQTPESEQDEPRPGTAVILHPEITGREDPAGRPPEARLEETVRLTRALKLKILRAEWFPVKKPNAGTLLGKGKIEEWSEIIREKRAEMAIVNEELTPAQMKKLSQAFGVKVYDRQGLILEIFADRARTEEARIKVELARKRYQRTHLVHAWSHLERQRGSLSFIGGPGEKQIELDRRRIDEQIHQLEQRLESVKNMRKVNRGGRQDPVVALIGYTNAGKSTLFNQLAKAQTAAQNQLFSTVDPFMRKIILPRGTHAILSDTVGFVSNLPDFLRTSFEITLEEVAQADLIVHVRDIAAPYTESEYEDVKRVLRETPTLEIDIEEDPRIVTVLNKADALDQEDAHFYQMTARNRPSTYLLSALKGDGLADLVQGIEAQLNAASVFQDIPIDYARDAEFMAYLYEHNLVYASGQDENGGLILSVRIPPRALSEIQGVFPEKVREHELET